MNRSHRFFQQSAIALLFLGLSAAPLAAAAAVESYLVGVEPRSTGRGIYLANLGQQPAAVSGPFFSGTFAFGFRLILLRDSPAGIVHVGSQLHLIDFSNPAAPALTASATLPFAIKDATRLSEARDELLVVGDGGQLAVIDPATLGIRATFTQSSPRRRVRTSRDGRLLLTQNATNNQGLVLATFDPVLGSGAEAIMEGAIMSEAAFSLDRRTVVVLDSFCWQAFLTGSPFCDTYLLVYDISDPATPVITQKFFPSYDLVTSSALDRSGEHLYFHHRGTYEFHLPHRLLPFDITGAGELTQQPPIQLTVGGDFQASGVVRTAGAKELLACTSETYPGPTVPRLHRYALDTGVETVSPLPVPLEPRGVIHIGASVFADGFESGTTGAWGLADLSEVSRESSPWPAGQIDRPPFSFGSSPPGW